MQNLKFQFNEEKAPKFEFEKLHSYYKRVQKLKKKQTDQKYLTIVKYARLGMASLKTTKVSWMLAWALWSRRNTHYPTAMLSLECHAGSHCRKMMTNSHFFVSLFQ